MFSKTEILRFILFESQLFKRKATKKVLNSIGMLSNLFNGISNNPPG
jgi:hypothetical protein